MKKFVSVGTITYKYDAASEKSALFFVPDSDHSLKLSSGEYAIFVGGSKKNVIEAIAVRLRSDHDHGVSTRKSIPISLGDSDDVRRVALGAAESAKKVTVGVKQESGVLELRSITIPAG